MHSLCQQIWKTQQQPQGWERSILIPIPKKGGTKECAKHQTTALISHARKVILIILHATLQHYANQELPNVQARFRKGWGTRGQIVNICWMIEKARGLQKNMYLSFIDYAKAFDCVDHDKLWEAFRGMEYQTISPVSWETCMWVKKQQLEPCMEQLIHSKSRKEYGRAVCCHPVCLTYMLSTSWEMPGWMSDKSESR